MDRTQAANLMDTHNRCVANILTRYKDLIMLATIQASGDDQASATPEAIAVARISMKHQFDSLYSSIKELLALSRRMKELWTFGPLGREDPDQRAKQEQLDENVRSAHRLLCEVEKGDLESFAKKFGGTWEAGTGEETTATTAPAPATAQGTNGAAGSGM
ncbi:surfeit locus protein 5 subunit 22 of mediator complex domain-containing protein [Sarocladium implicatum]|nr:surfeit locus protein 5 subunit 22 of mediator complex domain-containing protein [Sarocladium implicatum]